MKLTTFLFLVFYNVSLVFSQETGTVLLVSNLEGKVLLDGTLVGSNQANIPFKVQTSSGDHYIQVQGNVNGKKIDKGEIVNVEIGKQRILKWTFDEVVSSESKLDPIDIADINLAIPGSLVVAAWISNNSGKEYQYPSYYITFEKGDEIQIDLTMSNKSGTNALVIKTFPNGVVKYTNKSFTELKSLKLKVEERSIFQFIIGTNHVFDRNAFLKIKRVPESKDHINFNTSVSKQKIYKPIEIFERREITVNSINKATFDSNSKSRIIVPVDLPNNTVEWFYRFSCFRNPEDLNKAKNTIKLFSELLTLSGVGYIAGKAINIATNQLIQPPGSNYCDIYLLNQENAVLFEGNKPCQTIGEGSQKNLTSGNSKIDCCISGLYYLGINNPDSFYKINVALEAVAITMTEEYVMEQK